MANSAREPRSPQADQPDAFEPTSLDIQVEAPDAVDAASTFTVSLRVATDPMTDLRGERLDIKAGDQVVASGIELIEVDENGVHSSEPVELNAPATLGVHAWTVSIEPFDAEGASYDATQVPFEVQVKPHATRAQAWGAPSAIPAGATFQLMVGIKCSSGCDLSGRGFDIVAEDGSTIATGTVGDDTWKRTEGLYYGEVDLTAPASEGYATWQVRTHPADVDLPHDDATATFGVKSVPAPEHKVRVTAFDKDTREPIEGLQVLMHPFRALTDAEGVAELAVPTGEYRLYVSGLRYFPHDTRVEVSDDLETTVELAWEVRPEKIR